MRTQGYLFVEAHGAFDAICQAYGCLIDLGDFAIERIQPAMAQCWRRGRYDFGALDYVGEWRVPVTVRTDDAGTVPNEARRMLEHVGSFLDFRVYPERAQDDSGERHGDWDHQLAQHREGVDYGSASSEQGRGAHPALLAGAR
jgi:hypothetical protein